VTAWLEGEARGPEGRQAFGCGSCGAVFLAPPEAAGALCPLCAADELEPGRAEIPAGEPERALPFRLDAGALGDLIAKAVRAVPYPPADLQPKLLLARARRVWVPRWWVDARLEGAWSAEVGFDYEVQSTRESLRGGRWTTDTLMERRVRWEPRSGTLDRAYANAPAAAMHGEAQWSRFLGEAEGAEPCASLGDAWLWAPELDPASAWPEAEAALRARAAEDCRIAAGADHVREPTLRVAFHDPHWTWVLRPAWLTWYREDDGQPQAILISDATWKLAGALRSSSRRAWAWTLALLTATLALLGLVAAVALFGLVFPPMFAAAFVGLIAPLCVGLFVPAPLIRRALWNRGQRPLHPARSP
jgi:hypothetical protein